MDLSAELRCLVCQNQTIADSHAGLADDLRREIREQLLRGASDEQVVQYMTDRYGDFIRKVTREDVLRAAKRYLQPEKLITVVVGNQNKIGE